MDKYVGSRYGRLTVLEFVRAGKHYTKFYLCKCDCGNEKEVNIYTLTRGSTVSCGCHRKENAVRLDNKHRTHGESHTKLHDTWSGMKRRCYNRKVKDYPNYGGRGIQVCDEWRESYDTFRDWALANGFSDNLTIERKDVNKGYSPENCTWVNRKDQARNRRSSNWVTINGETKLLSEWCKEFNIPRSTVYNRMKRKGMSVEEALRK